MRHLIDWLHKRFPVQLVVNLEDWQRLDASLTGLSNSLVDLNKRIGLLENLVRRLNDSQGFNPMTKGGVRLER